MQGIEVGIRVRVRVVIKEYENAMQMYHKSITKGRSEKQTFERAQRKVPVSSQDNVVGRGLSRG